MLLILKLPKLQHFKYASRYSLVINVSSACKYLNVITILVKFNVHIGLHADCKQIYANTCVANINSFIDSINRELQKILDVLWPIDYVSAINLNTYIILSENNRIFLSSVKIIEPVSHTIYIVCVNFMHRWRDLLFKVHSERQISFF